MYRLFFLLLVVSDLAIARGVQDPTQPLRIDPLPEILSGAKNKAEALVIQSIFIGVNNRFILVEGDEYREGDQLRGMKIEKIDRDHIVVIKNGRAVKLPMFSKL